MPATNRVEIFYIYSAEENTQFKKKKRMLDNHLSFVKRRKGIDWYNYEFVAGSDTSNEIEIRLNKANIILFLMSADYHASGGYDKEAEIALNRHRRGEARVIPIIFRTCDWQHSDFGILSPLPQHGKGIFPGKNEDEECKEVQQGINLAIDEWLVKLEVQPQIERADMYFKQNIYEKALSLYDVALLKLEKTAFHKDIADLLRKIGTIQVNYNQKEAALQAYEQAIQQSSFNPMLPILYKEQGEILLDLQQWEAAIRAYDRAIDLLDVPGMKTIEIAQIYENKGEAFISLGKFRDALTAFDTAIEREPGKSHLWQYRGEVCSELEDMQEAKISYEEAIRLAKDNPYLHHEYGKMLYTFQRYFEALEAYNKALLLKPDFTQVYLDLSEVYTKLATWAQEEYKRRKNNGG